MVTLVLRFVVWESLVATGASFAHVTVMVPVAVLEALGQKLSLARYVKLSVPQKFASGV